MKRTFQLSWGAELQEGGVRYRLWAPGAKRVSLAVVGTRERVVPMEARENGWYEILDAESRAGTRYQFDIDGNQRVADPAARFAPEGPAMPSEVIDPGSFEWPDAVPVRRFEEMVFYELHVGTFTPSGTYREAQTRLSHLVELGITAIELMPVAERPGARNWGYDGVLWYAPANAYGRPEDLKAFIAAAHGVGLSVFLDVVYNHFGPEDNCLYGYARRFFTPAHHTPWGDAIDYASPGNEPVRDFAIENACYWICEYGFDGLRLDATQEIYDDRSEHVLAELVQRTRAAAGRTIYLVAENDENEVVNLRRGFDAQWNDDVHHCLHVALTGERDGYYQDYFDRPLELLGRALTQGYAYQGEASPFRDGRPRGAPTEGIPLSSFVNCLQNHDQIGNRALGDRIGSLASPQAITAALAVLLLAPSPPLLFMGEEWDASSPFLYFCDFEGRLAQLVTEGRRNEFARFAKFSDPKLREQIPDPSNPETFERSKLRWSELAEDGHRERFELYRQLLAIRREQIVSRSNGLNTDDGAYRTHGPRGLSARWRMTDGARLVLEANLGPESQPGFSADAPGRIVFATSQNFAGGVAPAWSVRWTLA